MADRTFEVHVSVSDEVGDDVEAQREYLHLIMSNACAGSNCVLISIRP